MRILDVFCGLKGWSQAFADRGHDVVSLDNNRRFNPDICGDVLTIPDEVILDYAPFDVVLLSPPCECFSVASISKHWTGGLKAYIPKDEKTRNAVKIVQRGLDIVGKVSPMFWVMENPRGVLRKIIGDPVHTITYCQYGETRMKPTDLWGNIPMRFIPRSCRNGDSCHERAPRGAKTGTQGINGSAERAKIPYLLSLEMCIACEDDL